MTINRSLRVSRQLAGGLIFALLLGCGGAGKGSDTPAVLQLACQADTPVTGDQVGLKCPASSLGSFLVTVIIGGPSTATDIYGVKFDLVFDGTVLAYQHEAGLTSFLEKNGGTTQVLASVEGSDPDRLVAATTLQGAIGGVQVTASKETVLGFMFMGLNSGTTTIRFENGQVVDSTLTPIGSISFTGTLNVDIQ